MTGGFQLPEHKEEVARGGWLLIYLALGCQDGFTYKVTTHKASVFRPSLAACLNLPHYGDTALEMLMKSTLIHSAGLACPPGGHVSCCPWETRVFGKGRGFRAVFQHVSSL